MARDVVLTEYVRHLIHEWEASGKTLAALETAAGAKSNGHFSQIKSGKLGASERVVQYMAKAFEKTPQQIRTDAYEYYAREGETLKRQAEGDVEDKALRDALTAIRSVGATPQGAIRSALKRWADMQGKGMSIDWWFTKISEEARSLELGAFADDRVQRKARRKATTDRREIRKVKEKLKAPPVSAPTQEAVGERKKR